MKTGIAGSILVTLLLLVEAAPAQATITAIVDDSICLYHCLPQSPYPVLRRRNVTITLLGQYVDLSTKVEVSA